MSFCEYMRLGNIRGAHKRRHQILGRFAARTSKRLLQALGLGTLGVGEYPTLREGGLTD